MSDRLALREIDPTRRIRRRPRSDHLPKLVIVRIEELATQSRWWSASRFPDRETGLAREEGPQKAKSQSGSVV